MNKTETWNGYTIRFVEHQNEWWAVLADIAKALDLNPKFIKQRLGDEVVSNNHVADSLGRQQEMLIVNEFGIYETIFSSRKKESKTFKLWVFETIKQLRQSTGLEGFQVFRMFDKEHQKQAMNRLVDGLQNATKKDLIKANTIANKAVSDLYGYPKMVSKNEMTENMLRDREPILDETVELIKVKEKYGLNFSVSEAIYNQNTIKKSAVMRVNKGEMIMKATTYKELKKWIDEGVDLAELAQGYADKVPNADREQFEAITQEIFNVLEGVSLMLDDKVLIYNRKAEQKRLNDIEQGNY